jgi:hypothetical protein
MQLLGWRWLPNWGAAVLRPYMKEVPMVAGS